MFRIDHNFSPNFRANHSFYWNRRPSVRNCEGVDGCNYEFDPEAESAQNTDYYGTASSSASRRTTRTSSSTGSSATTCSTTPRSPGTAGSWVGITCQRARTGRTPVGGHRHPTGGIVAQDAGPPTMRFDDGSIRTRPSVLKDWPRFGYEKNDRWQFSNDLTWVKGRHTLKTGFEFRHHTYPQKRLGARRRGGQLHLQPARHGRVRRLRQQPPGDGRPVCLVPPGAGAQSNQNLYVEPTWNGTIPASG